MNLLSHFVSYLLSFLFKLQIYVNGDNYDEIVYEIALSIFCKHSVYFSWYCVPQLVWELLCLSIKLNGTKSDFVLYTFQPRLDNNVNPCKVKRTRSYQTRCNRLLFRVSFVCYTVTSPLPQKSCLLSVLQVYTNSCLTLGRLQITFLSLFSVY